MKLTALTMPLLAASLAFASIAAVAKPPKDCGRPHHRMWNDLKLTEDQKGKLKTLHEEMMSVRDKHFETVKVVRIKIKNELLKDTPSRTVLYGYAGKLGELHKQMSKERGDHLLKVKAIFTPEQFSKMIDKDLNENGPGPLHGNKKCRNGKGKGCTGCTNHGNDSSKGHCKGAQNDTNSAK